MGPSTGEYGMLGGVSPIPVADDVLDPDVAALSLDDVAAELELSKTKIRQLLRDGQLIAFRRAGELAIPADFLTRSGIVKGLSSTITVLADSGFTSTEMLRWLFTTDDTLPGATPINALRTSHGKEVNRRAQAMAF